MESEETIIRKIQEMGYLTVKPMKIEPSYYNLDDGIILKIFTLVNSLHQNPQNPKDLVIASRDFIFTFTPKNRRGKPSDTGLTQNQLIEGIIEEDVDVETLRENFSTYSVSDGSILSTKTVVGQIDKTKYFNREGEPIYSVSSSMVPKIKKKKK